MPSTVRDVYGEMTRIASRKFVESSVNISLVHRYVYILNPKVANSTIKKTLQSAELSKSAIRDRKIDVHDRRASPLLWPGQLPREMFNQMMSSGEYFVFTFVRNPYARLLSAYLDKFIGEGPRNVHRRTFLEDMGRPATDVLGFDEFVDELTRADPATMNQHWRPQSICLLLGAVDYSFIGRLEDFDYQLGVVKRRLFGGRGAEAEVATATERPHQTGADSKLGRYYTPEIQAKVRTIYRDDFVNFGYPLDVVEPDSCGRGRVAVPVCRDASVATTFADLARAANRSDDAVAWYEEAEALGSREACYWLGRLAENRQAHDHSVVCYSRGAEQGQSACMRGLARAYQLGRGVAKDPSAEREWLLRAVNAGDAKSALRLAALEAAAGGETAALPWYEKAAALGAARAFHSLGRYHETHRAFDRSLECFRTGALQGDAACMRGLARAYELGRSVEPDADHAWYWNERAHPERAMAGAPPAAPGHFFVKLPRRPGADAEWGHRFLDILDGASTLGQRQLRRTGYGGYERDTAATLCAVFDLLADGASGTAGPGAFTFFDVGANVGHYALLCKSLWGGARVVAFEPSPQAHDCLVRVAAANGLDIRAEAVAVGARSGEATLYLSAKSDASNSLNPTFRAHKGEVSVRCVTLDELCAATDLRAEVIKIDVETHEDAVFEGGATTFGQHRPFVVVEVLSKGVVDYGERLERRLEAIGGYHYYPISDAPAFEPSPVIRARPERAGFRDWLLSPIELGDRFFARLAAFRRNLSLCTADTNVPPVESEEPLAAS